MRRECVSQIVPWRGLVSCFMTEWDPRLLAYAYPSSRQPEQWMWYESRGTPLLTKTCAENPVIVRERSQVWAGL